MLTMPAVRFGGPEVLAARQAPDPVAGPGQAVVFDGAGGELGATSGVQGRHGQDAAARLSLPGPPP